MRGILRCSEVSHAVVELREKPRKTLIQKFGGPNGTRRRQRGVAVNHEVAEHVIHSLCNKRWSRLSTGRLKSPADLAYPTPP